MKRYLLTALFAVIFGCSETPFSIETPIVRGVTGAYAQLPLADCATPPQTDDATKAFRNEVFDFHMGGHPDMEKPRTEYTIPGDANKSAWFGTVYGFTIVKVPGTSFTDFSNAANVENLSNAILRRTVDTSCDGMLFDCLNICAPGQFGLAVDFFFVCQAKLRAAGKIAIVNFGSWDAWAAETGEWGRLAGGSDGQFCQVAINVNSTSWFAQFSRALYVSNKRLNAGVQVVIVGAYDLNRKNEARARAIRDNWLSLAPRLPYFHYNTVPHNGDVRAQAFTTVTPPPPPPSGTDAELGLLGNLNGPVYLPADNWWNLDVRAAPLDPNSSAIITTLKSSLYENQNVFADLGTEYGIPYVVVGSETPLVPVVISNSAESDKGYPGGASGYPIPSVARDNRAYFEAGEFGDEPVPPREGDAHLLVLDRDRNAAFELSYAYWDGNTWRARYGAVFKLDSNYRRTEGYTSTDAAGMCVLAGLVNYDDVYGSAPIRHATRYSIRKTNGHVWPASHTGARDAGAPPLGMRLRLKASVDTSFLPPGPRKLAESWKVYGLICADRGGNLYVQGTMDPRWGAKMTEMRALRNLDADDFEVVKLGWKPTS
jgi:hypothetical protein